MALSAILNPLDTDHECEKRHKAMHEVDWNPTDHHFNIDRE